MPCINGHIYTEGKYSWKLPLKVMPLKGDDRLKKKLVVLALSLTLVVVFGHAALAIGAGNKCVRPNQASSQCQNQIPLAEKLKLSDRQVQQLKEINLSTYQSTKALKIKLMDAKFELRQLRIAGTDKPAIDEKVKQINDLQTQIHKLHQQKWQKMQSILNAEQQAQLKEMKSFGRHGGRYKEGRSWPK
jgi:Spy/CpxP family protein refolding chaperone